MSDHKYYCFESNLGGALTVGAILALVAGFFYGLYRLARHPIGRRLLIVAAVCIGLGIWQDGRRQNELPAGFPAAVEPGMLWRISTGEAMPILKVEGQSITVRTRPGYIDYGGATVSPEVETFPLRQIKGSVRDKGAHVGWPE